MNHHKTVANVSRSFANLSNGNAWSTDVSFIVSNIFSSLVFSKKKPDNKLINWILDVIYLCNKNSKISDRSSKDHVLMLISVHALLSFNESFISRTPLSYVQTLLSIWSYLEAISGYWASFDSLYAVLPKTSQIGQLYTAYCYYAATLKIFINSKAIV